MKPVTQTEIGTDNPKANCLMAAIASVLEVDLADLPDASDYGDWWQSVHDALEPAGLAPIYYQCSSSHFPPIAPPGYHIAVGKSPRSDHTHACVALDGKIVHDPHPSRAGLDGPITSWIIFMPQAAQESAVTAWGCCGNRTRDGHKADCPKRQSPPTYGESVNHALGRSA